MDQLTKGQEAKQLFLSGYNCAQAVVGAFYKEMNLSQETALLLASPFGGGMGRMREVCGTVSGMLMVLGALDGYLPVKGHQEEKKRVYEAVQALAEEFRLENGSIVCRELLGQDGTDRTAVPSPRTGEYYKKRPCANYVEQAANLIADYLEQNAVVKS